MENQNWMITHPLTATSMEPGPPFTTALVPATMENNTVPNVMGAVGIEPALNFVVGGSNTVRPEQPKKKRGRPRKYDLDGRMLLAPPPKVPSHSIDSFEQKQKKRPRETGKLQISASTGESGGFVVEEAGGSFTPHVIMVYPGQDVLESITTLSEEGYEGFFIISANGILSTAAIRHFNCGDIINYEGRFEILSLQGSVMIEGERSSNGKNGEITLTLGEPKGNKVFGGTVEGPMIAAGPIQVVVGTFKPNIKKNIQRDSSQSLTIPGKISSTSSSVPRHGPAESSAAATGMYGEEDSRKASLQFSKTMEQQERGSLPTTNGVLPFNAIPWNENMQSASLNGVVEEPVNLIRP